MSTLEQDLRRELSESDFVDARRTETARAEAVDAFVRCRRRARLRRAVSMSSGALSVAAIGALLALSLPTGDDRVPRAGAPDASLAFPVVSTLDRPAGERDRVVSQPDVAVDLASARWVAETPRHRFLVARGAYAGDICVLSDDPRPGRDDASAMSMAVCSQNDELETDGVIALAERRNERVDVGGVVVDGIDEVVVGDRRIPVRDNGFAVVWDGTLPGTITLVGPAAALVGRSEPQPGWRRRNLADGTPTVTVVFLPSIADDSPVSVGTGFVISDPDVIPVVETPAVPVLAPTAPEPVPLAWPYADGNEDSPVTPVVAVPSAFETVPDSGIEPVAPPASGDVWLP